MHFLEGKCTLMSVITTITTTMADRADKKPMMECPYCGYEPIPVSRSRPEFVDGDLCELDPATLAAMRGDVERVDMDPEQYRAELQAKHAPLIGQLAHVKRHAERQAEQANLRAVMAWWGGVQVALGRVDERENQRRFYHTFGVDVLTAQTLRPREANELAGRIIERLGDER